MVQIIAADQTNELFLFRIHVNLLIKISGCLKLVTGKVLTMENITITYLS